MHKVVVSPLPCFFALKKKRMRGKESDGGDEFLFGRGGCNGPRSSRDMKHRGECKRERELQSTHMGTDALTKRASCNCDPVC